MEYIMNLPIYKLCMEVDRMPVLIRFVQWWYYDLNQEEEGNGTSKGLEREVG